MVAMIDSLPCDREGLTSPHVFLLVVPAEAEALYNSKAGQSSEIWRAKHAA